ncbi:MAG: hypothetical protein AAF902_09765, partial [Chloroflexota bacterium]
MDVITDWILSMLANMLINAYLGIATAVWWCVKVVNVIASYITTETLWTDVLDGLLTNITNVMPDVLQGLVYSPTGIFYAALSISGLMIILNRPNNKIAETPKVIIWGALVGSLFVGSTLGYDLISYFEQLRLQSANLALTTIAPTGEISDLVNVPMRATTAEGEDLGFVLPAQFEDDFFPGPDPADINTQDALIYDSFLLGPWTLPFEIEDAGAQQARKEAAVDGLFIALLTVGPAVIEGMFAAIYAAIAAATFVLIIFFVSVLPLGFFSFGQEIIEKIIWQYMMMWMLTVASSVIIGVLLGSGSIFLPTNPSISQIVASYFPILIVTSIAVTYIMKLAFQVMVGTAGMVTATIRDEIGNSAYNTQVPTAGEVPLSGIAKAGVEKAQKIALLGSAAVSGGLSIAALGGLAAVTGGSVRGAVGGAVMSRFRPEAARDAAMLARYTSDSQMAQSFAATAMGRNVVPAAIGLLATRPDRGKDIKKPVISNALAESKADDEPNDDDFAQKVEKNPITRPEKNFQKVAEANGVGGSKELRELIRIMRASRTEAKRKEMYRPDAAASLMTTSENEKVRALGQAERMKVATAGLRLMDDQQAKELTKAITNVKGTQLGQLKDDKKITSSDITRAIQLGFKAMGETELTGKENGAERLAEMLADDKKFGKLPAQTQADIGDEIQTILGIEDNRTVDEIAQLAEMIDKPATAPSGADYGAMAIMKRLAEENNLDLEKIMGYAKAGADEANQGINSTPEQIYEKLNDSEEFKSLPASLKTELANNADLILQSVDLPTETPSDVAVNVETELVQVELPAGQGETEDVRVVEDQTQRDAMADKVEIVGDKTQLNGVSNQRPPEPEAPSLPTETPSDVVVNVETEPVQVELPAGENGMKDVRVVEDQTQRDAMADKVEIVGDKTQLNGVSNQRPPEPEAPPLPTETPSDVVVNVETEPVQVELPAGENGMKDVR